MKKLIGLLIIFLLLSGGAWYGYNYYYGGKDYYTKITVTGDAENGISSTGEPFTSYHYTQKAYDKDGHDVTQKMTEYREKPLRIGAYLKLKVNKRKGVLSWEEVSQKDIPEKALNQIEAAK
ncbi:YxeA family protein [Enterococcus sp. BWB1-3]|uniref:YxeA family protein n=1 Tax=Enterococcus sp. BWB1-3 TaxID=2787713 RepID=UPI001922F130|nr:YxeA family protein [Enterococcus sp. BWB1-3]MBL1230985.1 YxeA family protein [Enterococcus sp. BWB1-3]